MRRGTCESAVKGNQSRIGVQGGRLRVSHISHEKDPAVYCSPSPAACGRGPLLGGLGLRSTGLGETWAADSAPGAGSARHRNLALLPRYSYPFGKKKKSSSVPAPLSRPPVRAGRVAEARLSSSRRRLKSCVPAPGRGPRGAGAPPMRGLAFPEGRCHMAALSETRPRAGLQTAEGGGGRGWPVAASLRARQRRARPPAPQAAALAAGPFLPTGESQLRRVGATTGSRPGPQDLDRVSCYSFVLPRQVSLTETGELHLALSCLLLALSLK